jgi:hypothetical protein
MNTVKRLVLKTCRTNIGQCWCNLNLFIIFFRVLAVQSPENNDDKQLLIYWIVYASLTCFEYLEFSLFNLLIISFEFLGYCLSGSLLFYWLAKSIFLVWLMKSGSRMISRRFIENTDLFNDGQNSEYQSPSRVGSDLRSGRVIEKICELGSGRVTKNCPMSDFGEYRLRSNFIFDQKWTHALVKHWSIEFM